MKYTAIDINASDSINLEGNILFRVQQFGFRALNSSTNILMKNNYVMDMRVRDAFRDILANILAHKTDLELFLEKAFIDPHAKALDASACFYICPNDSDGNCNNILLDGNTCGGSDFMGIVQNGVKCGTVWPRPTPPKKNIAYAANYGFLLTNNGGRINCVEGGNMLAYNNFGWGVQMNPTAEGGLKLKDVILSNNLKGLSVNAGASVPYMEKNASNIIIIGQNPNHPVCYNPIKCPPNDLPCTQYGMMFSASQLAGVSFPVTSKTLPLSKLGYGDPAAQSFFSLSDSTFYNFDDLNPDTTPKCSFFADNESKAIVGNKSVPDHVSIHTFHGLNLVKIHDDNFIYVTPEDPAQAFSQFCGAFPCSAANNVLLEFKTVKPHTNQGSIKRIVDGSVITATTARTKSIDFFNSDIGRCDIANPKWNSSICSPIASGGRRLYSTNEKWGQLISENLDLNRLERVLAPVMYFTDFPQDDGTSYRFETRLNSFGDHGCVFGYPSFKRTPIFPALVMQKRNYEVTYNSTNPTLMKFHLVDSGYQGGTTSQFDPSVKDFPNREESGMIVKIRYTEPKTVIVLINNLYVVKPLVKKNDIFKIGNYAYNCGDNRWNIGETLYSIEFYISNAPTCHLYLKQVNSIQLSLRLNVTVEEFYAVGGPNEMIYNIAALMKISPDQIRITNLTPGSTWVAVQILQEHPQTGTISANTLTASTYIPDLLLFGADLEAKLKANKVEIIRRYPLLDMSWIISNKNGNIIPYFPVVTTTNSSSSQATSPEISTNVSVAILADSYNNPSTPTITPPVIITQPTTTTPTTPTTIDPNKNDKDAWYTIESDGSITLSLKLKILIGVLISTILATLLIMIILVVLKKIGHKETKSDEENPEIELGQDENISPRKQPVSTHMPAKSMNFDMRFKNTLETEEAYVEKVFDTRPDSAIKNQKIIKLNPDLVTEELQIIKPRYKSEFPKYISEFMGSKF